MAVAANKRGMNYSAILYWILVSSLVILQGEANNIRKTPRKISRDESKITCKGEAGQGLDWFVAYKLAKIPESDDANIREGYGHALLYPGMKIWLLSTKSVNDSQSAIGLSTSYIFQKSASDLLYVTYNDQPPSAPAVATNGHTKGVIIANHDGGIWLQHSVPHFPSPDKEYFYPKTGEHNGQTFFCMTLSPEQIDNTVAGILTITKPHIYSNRLPASLKGIYPNLGKLLSTKQKRKGKSGRQKWPKSNNFNLDVGGLNLTIFAKAPKLQQEIYSDWIAPTFKTNLKVQSWLNGAHPLNCTLKPYTVLNIDNKSVAGADKFSTHIDHSKWAIGESEWTCIADLNRMDHQKFRGGAALCSQDKTLWSNFHDIIVNLQPCPFKKSRHYL